MNCIGGSIPGRYLEQQMPFAGINNVAGMRNILTMVRADFRFNVAKNHYVSGIVNYARDCDSFPGYLEGPGTFGAALEYSYDAIFGPVSANLHWSSMFHKVGFYVSIGYDF